MIHSRMFSGLLFFLIIPGLTIVPGITALAGINDTGGPDEYGYTWIDSNEPGGPLYQWVDISQTGIEVTGLEDDACSGPFSLGFEFPYYWYEVDALYIGSNGYVLFDSPTVISQPFPASIPQESTPDNYIAPYMADWHPGAGGQGRTYFWTNQDDSCVVTCEDYPAYFTGGSHTFQLILCASDSSITFQYGQQQGLVSNHDILIGIEAAGGHYGLEHSHDQYIAYENSAIRFDFPDQPAAEISDLSAEEVLYVGSPTIFQLPDRSILPWGQVKNLGNRIEVNYPISVSVTEAGGSLLYDELLRPESPFLPGEMSDYSFPLEWSAAEEGIYIFTLLVDLAGDVNRSNDTLRTECRIVELPGTLQYDDGSAEVAWRWDSGTGGLAQRFVPPTYYAKIESISVYIAEDGGTEPFTIEIFDDDGVEGSPGNLLYENLIDAPLHGFYGLNLTTEEIVIQDGAFYIAWQMSGGGTPGVGLDQSPGQIGSRQSWEYAGYWLPFRQAETADPMIRCTLSHIAPPNSAPEIMSHYPVYLDTTILGNQLDFWVSVTDLDEDPLLYEWRVDEEIVATDSAVTIPFSGDGDYEVIGWVSDGELSDSVVWLAHVQVFAVDPADEPVRPAEFSLEMHPNPANPMTIIQYVLDEAGWTTLGLYNIQGQRLMNKDAGWQLPGRYSMLQNLVDLSSGVYIMELRSGQKQLMRKLVVMK